MTYRSFSRTLCVVAALVAMGCAGTPNVAAADRAAAQTLNYKTPFSFSSKSSACNFAVGKARSRAAHSCSVSALSVARDDCECTRDGGKFGCEIEAAYTCR